MALDTVSLLLVLGVLLISSKNINSGHVERSFAINHQDNCFMKDHQPFRYISGEMHYFRIPSIYWKDRLLKAKALGLNTIQTYIPWNIHEVKENIYDFKGEKDLSKFIEIAEELGLLVILRPGPYIDAEWEYGGFPWWLVKNQSMKMRTSDPVFMHYVENWFDKLFPMLESKIYKNGGPVIAFQVENEYGSFYACDKNYLRLLKVIYDKHFGENSVVLFTVDGYTDDELECGTIPELYITIDFGIDAQPKEAFRQQRKYQKSGPLVNSEYYTGWLDYWGYSHQRRNASIVAKQLDAILSIGASVSMYMLHGGTNFGFMNGVDLTRVGQTVSDHISPTSYDYDAPLSEAGDTTRKYFKIRDVLKKYVEIPPDPIPKNTTKSNSEILSVYPYLDFNGLVDRLSSEEKVPVHRILPLSMEGIGQGYGFIVYRTIIPSGFQNVTTNLTIEMVTGRTIIIVDGKISSIHENRGRVEVNTTLGKQLDIFVENQGRAACADKGVHYLQGQDRGILGNVFITNRGSLLLFWQMFSVNDTTMKPVHGLIKKNTGDRIAEQMKKPVNTISTIVNQRNDYTQNVLNRYSSNTQKFPNNVTNKNIINNTGNIRNLEDLVQPTGDMIKDISTPTGSTAETIEKLANVYDGYIVEYYSLFDVPNEPTDSYLRIYDFDKGQVYINGINIGRFWQSKGPQKTLYVPKSCIVTGSNVIGIISLSNLEGKVRTVQFLKEPDLG